LLEEKLKLNLISKSNFEKIFSIEEQNNWFAASDKDLSSFFILDLISNNILELILPYGYGEFYKLCGYSLTSERI
jgi:hypothetical protein